MKVDIRVPLFHDLNTPEFIRETTTPVLESDTEIHMDAMAFGMGMCCLVCLLVYEAIRPILFGKFSASNISSERCG